MVGPRMRHADDDEAPQGPVWIPTRKPMCSDPAAFGSFERCGSSSCHGDGRRVANVLQTSHSPAGVDTSGDTGLQLHGNGRKRKQTSALKSPSMVPDASAADA